MPIGSTRKRRKSRIAQIRAELKRLFIYTTDVWHFCLGLLAGFIFLASRWITVVSIITYMLYQHFECEPVYESVKDMVTFFTGLIIALIIVM